MLSRLIKLNIYNSVVKNENFLGNYKEYDGIITFLNKIWDLRSLPSEDSRYTNANEDAFQHLVNNDDWTIDYLFLDRLKLIDGEESKFILFIETIVDPTVRVDKNDIFIYATTINSFLNQTGFKLLLSSYFEELPVYKYKSDIGFEDLPVDIELNLIPVYKNDYEGEKIYPYFEIHYDNWNDYNYITCVNLIFYQNSDNYHNIGSVRIMKINTNPTWNALENKFTQLSNEFCSLGIYENYYTDLKKLLGKDFSSFLLGMRDVAIFPKIYNDFENDIIFKTSLLRANDSERIARTIRYKVEGFNIDDYFKFNYTFTPPYSESEITLNFDFKYDEVYEHRIYALIGKNGTGKTQVLSSLANNLSNKASQNFKPHKPAYGKIFTVSYSYFDKFEIPKSDVEFNYVYCGLKKNDSTFKTEDDLLSEIFQSAIKIKEKNLENDWYEILSNFISKDILDLTFDSKENFFSGTLNYSFDEIKFIKIHDFLSSGQTITLYMITRILSEIRFDSLILFDEPETHLHPNAISSLINTLYDLVKRFESFCVIGTHSPIVIQEIPARNIFVIERENNFSSIRRLERESLGENLTVITQDIFGNSTVPKHFVSLIKDLIDLKKTYEEIVSLLESNYLPVSSNIRLYIKALISEQR